MSVCSVIVIGRRAASLLGIARRLLAAAARPPGLPRPPAARAPDPAAVHRPGDLAALRSRRRCAWPRPRTRSIMPAFLARVPMNLPLDAALPVQCARGMPLLEAIEQRASSQGVAGRLARRAAGARPAMRCANCSSRSTSTASSSPPTKTPGPGLSYDDLRWLLERVPAEILILRPAPEDTRRISGRGRQRALLSGGPTPARVSPGLLVCFWHDRRQGEGPATPIRPPASGFTLRGAVLHGDRRAGDPRPPRARSLLLAGPDRAERSTRSTSCASCSAFIRWRSRTPLHFGQRPKLDDYGDYMFLVFYGAWRDRRRGHRAAARGADVHLRQVPGHGPPRPAAGAGRAARATRRPRAAQRAVPALPRVRRAHRQLLPAARARWTTRSTSSRTRCSPARPIAQLQRLFAMKRQLVAMRKVVTPQRDLFARSIDQLAELPGPRARRARLLPRRLRPPDPHLAT